MLVSSLYSMSFQHYEIMKSDALDSRKLPVSISVTDDVWSMDKTIMVSSVTDQYNRILAMLVSSLTIYSRRFD